MQSSTVKIVNKRGLHARAASKLVDLTKSYASEITLNHAGKDVDAKSIMGVLMLGAPIGSELTLNVSGTDEELAAEAVQKIFQLGFYELDEPD